MVMHTKKQNRHAFVFRCRNCDICLFCNDNCRHAAWIQYHRFECYGLQRHFWENDVSFTALRTLLLGIDTEDFLFGVINSSAKHISAYRYIYNSESHMVQKSTKELNVILHVRNSPKMLLISILRSC